MTTLATHLSKYAAYHKDRRNVATHMIGIPMIVLAIVILLSRPVFAGLVGIPVTPALIAAIAVVAFYFSLEIWLGLLMGALFGLSLWAGAATAGLSTFDWLGLGAGLFFIGWVIQFVGHAYEGRKPAFFDEVVSLLIGPAFVVVEAGFMIGLFGGVRRQMETAAQSGRSA